MTPFTTGVINRQHHDNSAPDNIFEITSYIYSQRKFKITLQIFYK